MIQVYHQDLIDISYLSIMGICFAEKYRIENRIGNPEYKIHMLLTVRNLESEDFGTYRCVAKNPRGETDGSIKVYSK